MTRASRFSFVLSALTGAAVLASVSGPAAAQQFNCNQELLTAERTICASERLSGLDDRMSALYARLVAALDRDDQREGLRDYQLRFLATRDACGRDRSCIEGAYLDQIEVLKMRLRYAVNRWDQ